MVCNTAHNLNAFSMQLRCFCPVISLTFQPKSNAIAKQGELDWIEERLLQDFKDEQKETKAVWIEGGKIVKRKRMLNG